MKIPVYVLNDFLKFERKLYSLFGINLGRSIQFKTITYFAVMFAVIFLLALVPVIGAPFAALPILVKVGLAGAGAYLLTDVGTENRPPVNAFLSFCRYHWMAFKKETYFRGKVITAPRPVRFGRAVKVQDTSLLRLDVPKQRKKKKSVKS